MAPKIIVADNPMNDNDIARELAPPGFELVITRPDTPGIQRRAARRRIHGRLRRPSMNDGFYKTASKLKLVQLLSAGYDRCDIEAARRAGVPICNNGGANAIAVAEHAMLLMLAVSRRLIWQHDNVASGRWRGNNWAEVKLYELYGRKLGIIGLGTIGKKVARLAQAFGMDVQYYDIARLTEDQADALGVRFRLMDEIFARPTSCRCMCR